VKTRQPKTALITGGGRGIGAACAEAFYRSGANVVVISRTARELESTSRKIAGRRNAARILALAGDVADESFVKAVFSAARARFGRVDVLVNNAAILVVQEFSKLTVEEWDATMAVNLRGPFLCSREFARQFDRPDPRARRVIVNIASLGGISGTPKFPGLSAYVASKFGIAGLTEALAVEGRKNGIITIGLAPGAVATAMLRKAAPHLKAGAVPRDIARLVLEIVESESSFLLSGAVIPLDTNR
jgi:NAD(P)-dependent dehydrogenase (short-subunit alcohol dehydrogenase family)